MRKFYTYEVCYPLGSGGSLVKRFKSLDEAKEFKGSRDLYIYKSLYTVTDRGTKLRNSSTRVG